MYRNGVISPLGKRDWLVTVELPPRPDGRPRRWARKGRGTQAEAVRVLDGTRDETMPATLSPLSFPIPRDVAETLEARAHDSGRSVGEELRFMLAIQSTQE